ncbi:MAG: hypothetical protein RLZZ423_674 [Cyanobacteriota bacterium]|jgi:hypothetical protein
MDPAFPAPCWTHRDCQVRLVGHPLCEDAYEIRHRSGEWLGTAPTLTAARELIDGSILLVRQRLAMTA